MISVPVLYEQQESKKNLHFWVLKSEQNMCC